MLQAFSFLALFLFIGMLVYFFAARYVLRWSTHGEKPPNKEYEPTNGNDDADYWILIWITVYLTQGLNTAVSTIIIILL